MLEKAQLTEPSQPSESIRGPHAMGIAPIKAALAGVREIMETAL